MPTAAKLVASILLAISGAIVVMVTVNVYPDIARRGNGMMATAVVLGLFNGWLGLGKKIPHDENHAIFSGLKSGVTFFLWVLFFFAMDGMIAGIMAHAYYEPMSAVLQIPARMLAYGRMAMDIQILGTMLVLSGFVGVVTKGASRRWS